MRLAIAGFRHGHVAAFWATAQRLDFVQVVACVEEDPAAREGIPKELGVTLTHDTFEQVLKEVEFDALACVDTYVKRGVMVIRALEAGKHVITDKPLCTAIVELREIARLARLYDRVLHVDLTLRYDPTAVTAARLVQEGAVGEIAAITIFGQHPLAWGTRPRWYFEAGKHGGTLNDIMVHGLDWVRWATRQEFTHVIAATASGVPGSPAPPCFQQSAQCLMRLENGARVFADASYLAPTGHPSPWRFYLWGSDGHLYWDSAGTIELQRANEPARRIQPDAAPGMDPFEDFARQVEFGDKPVLSREDCFASTMAALTAQQAADTGHRDVTIGTI